MTSTDQEFDEYGKRILAPLRQAPGMDPMVSAEAKKQFILQGESLRQGLNLRPGARDKQIKPEPTNIFGMFQRKPILKALAAIIIAVVIILSGSTITVAAAQSSLPGDPLYSVKSWSEEVRLSLAFSTKTKLNLTLDYTNRRVDEIQSLLAGGKAVNDQTSDRFQQELDSALQLAARLDDSQIQFALGQIKKHAENQGMTIEELMILLPSQAEPAIIRLQERLNEQVQLSSFGESDPEAFRAQMRERQQIHKELKDSTKTEPAESGMPGITVTPMPEKNDNNNGNNTHQPTDMPGQGNPGNGKSQNTPGNGNHDPNGTNTQEP